MQINSISSYNYNVKQRKPFAKNARHISFGNTAQKTSKNIIKKASEKAESALSNGIHWISKTKAMKNITAWTAKDKKSLDKLQFGSMIGLSTVLDILYARRALKQKGIEEDRKHTLALNFLATMVFAFAGAILLDKRLNKVTGKVQKRFVKLNKELIKKQHLQGKDLVKANKRIDSAVNGIRIFKNTIIIAIVYRFVGPVLATPAADKLTKLMKKKGWIKPHTQETK